MLEIGLKGCAQTTVGTENIASTYSSGSLPVFATPAMLALMEQAAHTCVQPYLEEGQGTVGTLLNVKHLAATPLGMGVRAECELIEVDRRRLVFTVCAYDDVERIGEGVHERFIIDDSRFMEKARTKIK
ncbi:MAG: thioesterase family protein [Clostridia bacterium]|nr:thioesterase family protein [Clostridia bacterium]